MQKREGNARRGATGMKKITAEEKMRVWRKPKRPRWSIGLGVRVTIWAENDQLWPNQAARQWIPNTNKPVLCRIKHPCCEPDSGDTYWFHLHTIKSISWQVERAVHNMAQHQSQALISNIWINMWKLIPTNRLMCRLHGWRLRLCMYTRMCAPTTRLRRISSGEAIM